MLTKSWLDDMAVSEATIEAVTPIGPTCRSTNTVAGSISFSCESVDHRRRYHGIDVRFSSATSLKSVSALIRSGSSSIIIVLHTEITSY